MAAVRLRSGKASALIMIFLLLLGMAAVATYYVYRAAQPVRMLPWLSEELGPQPVLTSYTVGKLVPGTVFQVYGDKEGWQIKQKDAALYEKLDLSDVDLGVNDVIAWHGYDVFTSGSGDAIVYSIHMPAWSAMNMTVRALLYDVDWWAAVAGGFGGSNAWRFLVLYEDKYHPTVHATLQLTNSTDGSSIGTVENDIYDLPMDSAKTFSLVVKTSGEFDAYVDNAQAYSATFSTTDVWFPQDVDTTYAIGARTTNGGTSISDCGKDIISYVIVKADDNIVSLADPTFFNGTHYFDLITGKNATTFGNPVRIPATHTWLWLIKSLASDNKLHFKWFPEGTIIRIKDSNGNVIREFTISGTPANDDGQIANYSISLDTTTIPSATVIAYVPSFKVRVYGPYGATVEITDDNGNVYGEGTVGTSGYTDITLARAIDNAKVVVLGNDYVENKLNVDVKEGSDGTLTITVTDDKGVLVPGLLVRVADPAGVVIYAGTTGDDGKVSFKPGRPLTSVTVEASGIWNGDIEYTKKEVQLSASTEAATVASTSSSESSHTYYMALGLGVIALLLLAMLLVSRRR